MKNWLSVLNNRFVYATLMTAMVSSNAAYAATTNQNIKKLLGDETLSTTITIGFGIFAAFKWFEYFSGFDPGTALIKIILPAVLTFMTFQWQTVLKWVGVM
jgi:hypothetical protein